MNIKYKILTISKTASLEHFETLTHKDDYYEYVEQLYRTFIKSPHIVINGFKVPGSILFTYITASVQGGPPLFRHACATLIQSTGAFCLLKSLRVSWEGPPPPFM